MSRRRGHDDGGAHGGSWKIALADLMTVLMVFFLVMWLTSIIDPEERKAFVNAISGEPPLGAEIQAEEMLPPQESLVDLEMHPEPPVEKAELEEVLKDVDQKNIDIEDTPEFTIITLRSDSFFESGRATISDSTRAVLEQLGETLVGREQPITITGYTDNIPINNFQFPSNWELSAARAATVARVFIDMGMFKQRLTISGKSDNDEVTSNATAYGRSLNRRVIIKIDKRSENQLDLKAINQLTNNL